MANPVEVWKSEKHPFDVWSDVEAHAATSTPMDQIPSQDLERMKWHGFFYRKRDSPGRYMNRIRITANEMTAEQAKEIALMAYEYGHGIVDVTTRANVQIQGLEISHLPKVAGRLEKIGLTARQTGHDNIRNVFGHPFSGLMSHDLIDTRQLCRDVDAIYLNSREFSDLPRKLNICFNGTENHPAHFWTQDISFLAAHNADGEVGFQVLLAGTQGQNPRLAWHLPVFVYPHQVVSLTRAIIELFRAKGSREKRNNARLRFLVEEIGLSGVLEWLEEKLPFRLEPSISEPVPTAMAEEFVGWFRQNDPKLWTMGLSVPLGRMTWRQLEGLAILSRKWGHGQLRTTQEQGIAVVNIPTGFKSAAATDAAALGLSVYADEYDLNTMACTGSQFCNIAVTETKGHMLQLIEKLRKRALKLHGIRIHMSGCPSSCAQHFTADIGLKGVRVRRLLGTREGFDVLLGGGISGQVHMGLPYRMGVDIGQLPTLIEEAVHEYYLRHKPGQTFSSYWRDRIQAEEAKKVGDADYMVPTWVCDGCDHHHHGEDPPVFCPSCAGLRRLFARIENPTSTEDPLNEDAMQQTTAVATPTRTDGFVVAAKLSDIPEKSGLAVKLAGSEYALYRHEGGVRCIDAACPHEGASLAEGDFNNGVVRCPWHDWAFNVCTGCSIDHPGNDIKTYDTTIEGDQVLVRIENALTANSAALASIRSIVAPTAPTSPRSMEAELAVLEIIDETPDVKSFRLDNSAEKIPFDVPGKFAKVCVDIDGVNIWKSFTVSSSPVQPRILDLTIKRNPDGQVTNYLFDRLRVGSKLKIKGTQGGYFFDPEIHPEPLVLISVGSGITPMLSIMRFIEQTGIKRRVSFLHGSRTPVDIIRHDECLKLAESTDWFHYFVTLTQPSGDWTGGKGRLGTPQILERIPDTKTSRYFLCGPNDFMDNIQNGLIAKGIPKEQIHTEQFHSSGIAKLVTV